MKTRFALLACIMIIKKINWDEREKELIEILDQYRSKDGYYDVLVPGSGGKDSDLLHMF